MMTFKAFKVVILAPTVTFLVTGCSSSDSSPRVLPNVDGLNLLKPQFNTTQIDKAIQSRDLENVALQKKMTEGAQNIERLSELVRAQEVQKESLLAQKAQFVAELEKLSKTSPELQTPTSKSDSETVLEQKISELNSAQMEKANQIVALRSELNNLGFFARNFTEQPKVLRGKIASAEKEHQRITQLIAQLMNEKLQLNSQKISEADAIRAKNLDSQKAHIRLMNTLKDKIAEIEKQIIEQDQQKSLLAEQIARQETSLSKMQDREAPESNQVAVELEKLKLNIINQYKNGEKVNADDIAAALILKHFLATPQGEVTLEELKTQLQAVVQKVSTSDPKNFKSEYEKIISADLHKNQKLVYNREAISILDPIINNKIQCYSGTLLFLVLNELFVQTHDHTVVIFTRGHVLPGYIQFNKSGQMNLYGIETTADGKAVIDYGKTSSIYGDIRVFDAQQFMLVELFKNEISDFQSLYSEMLRTISVYGFSTDEFKSLEVSSNNTNTDDILNATPFGFGRSNVAAGDIVRSMFDEQVNTNYQKVETPLTTTPEGAIEGSPIEWARTVEKPCDELYSEFHFYRTTKHPKYKFYQYYCSDLGKQEPCENYNESRDYQVALLKRLLEKKCSRDNRDIQLISFKDYVVEKGGYYNIPPPPLEYKPLYE